MTAADWISVAALGLGGGGLLALGRWQGTVTTTLTELRRIASAHDKDIRELRQLAAANRHRKDS